jgi:hypothetical protein
MSLKDQAETIQRKLAEIQAIGYRIAHLCELVLTEHKINGDTIKFSVEDQQKLIQKYQSEKTEL